MRYNYIKDRLQDDDVIPLVRRIMASGKAPSIRGHPADRMAERDIELDDIHKVLRKGSLCPDKTRRVKGGWRYRIKLDRADLSEKHIVVVLITSKKSMTVVTTMKEAYKS